MREALRLSPDPKETGLVDSRVDVGELSIRYLKAGNPHNPPLFLIHGASNEAAQSYKSIIEPLAKQGFYVVAPDMPGYGGSSLPKRYDTRSYVTFSRDFLDAQGIEKADILGHSQGGNFAWRLALHAPERVNHLILENSYGLGQRLRIKPRRESPNTRARLGIPKEAFIQVGSYFPSLSFGLLELWQRLMMQQRDYSRISVNQLAVGDGFDEDVEIRKGKAESTFIKWLQTETRFRGLFVSRVNKIQAQTLVVAGAMDDVISPDWIEKALNIPESTPIIFEGSGHSPHKEEPERFSQVIGNFLKR